MWISPGYVYFDCYWLAMVISIAMCWLGIFRLLWASYGFFDCALPWVLACYVLAMGILIAMGWL
jgi:hypothetical protein